MVKLFGTTIAETINALSGRTILGGRRQSAAGAPSDGDKGRAIARLLVTAVLLAAGIYFVRLDQHDSQTIGSSLLSGIVGYWLK